MSKHKSVDSFAEQLDVESGNSQSVDTIDVNYTEELPEESTNLGEMIPTMSVSTPVVKQEDTCIISDEKLLNLYDEIVQNCREDRQKVNEIQSNFEEMVLNEGDATSASKEALVNLMKIKTDINDKLSKIADFQTRLKMKEKNTFPAYLAQHNTNVTFENFDKRDILKSLHQNKG
jgi:hypothetical protein